MQIQFSLSQPILDTDTRTTEDVKLSPLRGRFLDLPEIIALSLEAMKMVAEATQPVGNGVFDIVSGGHEQV